jgi:hypothetical protein
MKYLPYTVDHFDTMDTASAPWDIQGSECQLARNLRQKNNGAWYGREGSLGHEYGNTNYPSGNFPYESRLIHEYRTTIGTAAVGKAGVTSDGATYLIDFVNTDTATASGGIFIRKVDSSLTVVGNAVIDDNIETTNDLIQRYVDTVDGASHTPPTTPTLKTSYFVAETDIIPKGLTFHGRAILPLPINGTVEVWIENGIWYCRKVVRDEFATDTVLIDARLANENGSAVTGPLALAAFKVAKGTAVAQTDAQVGTEDPAGYTGSGNANAYVVNRADEMSEVDYDDVEQDPVRDNDKEPIVVEEISVAYTARPSASTGFDYVSDTDVYYRPKGQVAKWKSDTTKYPHKDEYPRNEWGYRFVWQFSDGRFSNPSADIRVGDLLWSVFTGTEATSLHSDFNNKNGMYGEPANGLLGSTLAANANATDVTFTVTSALVFPVIPSPGSSTDLAPDGFWLRIKGKSSGTTNWAWCTNVNTGTNVLTVSDRPDNSSAFVIGDYVDAYYDANSTVDPVASFSNDAENALKSLKTKLYATTHPHYADDVFMTCNIIGTDHDGYFCQRDIGQTSLGSNWLGCEDNSNKVTFASRNAKYPALYDLKNAITTEGYLKRYAGMAVEFRKSEGVYSGDNATGKRGVWTNFAGDDTSDAGKEHMASQVPNILNVKDSFADMDYMNESVAAASPYLVLKGKYDWVFCRTASQAQTLGRSMRFTWGQWTGAGFAGLTKFHVCVKSQYECRMLVDAKRLIWDWQLSQLFPASVIWEAPRMGFTIKDADIPEGATKLLVFRTKMSTDPSSSPTQYPLCQIVEAPATGDLYFFDTVKDSELDFSDDASNYEGIRFGVKARYIETMGERVVYANTTTYYQPLAPRGQIENAVDATNPENTVCRIIIKTATVNDASPFLHTGNDPVGYKLRFKDAAGNFGETVTIVPIDLRADIVNDDYVVVGYFLSQGYNESIASLEVYRPFDSVDYKKAFSIPLGSGGYFYDDTTIVGQELWTSDERKTEVNPSAIWYSEPLHPEFIPSTNLIEFRAGDGDYITGVNIQFSNIIGWKNRSMCRLFLEVNIDEGAVRLEVISTEEGCIAPCSIVEHAGSLFWLSQKGVRMLVGGNAPQPLDRHVYTDIQDLIRPVLGVTQTGTPVTNEQVAYQWTAAFVPRYSEYWLLANMPTRTVDTTLASNLADNGTTMTVAATLDSTMLLPARFVIGPQGGYTDYGWITAVDQHEATIVRSGTSHAFTSSAAVKIYIEQKANGWIFDLSDIEHQGAKPTGLITSTIQFMNKKLFLTGSNGYLYSTIFSNPAQGSSRKTAAIIEEDYHDPQDYIQSPNPNTTTENVIARWQSKRFPARMLERLKRVWFNRWRFEHNGKVAMSLPAAKFWQTMYNASSPEASANGTSRYIAPPASGTAFRNVKFVSEDYDRSLDLEYNMEAPAFGLVLHGIESDMRVLQNEQ